MKKLIAWLLTICLLMMSATALADVAYGTLNQRISTRTGPGTKYSEPGSFLSSGNVVKVHTKVWDNVNEIWWVQVEFTADGDTYRAYTGSWRMNVDLSRVPQERSLGTVRVTYDADVFAGPGWEYVMWNDTVYRGTTATLLEVENGYGHIEYWNSWRNEYWRVWARLSDLSCSNQFSSYDDTYPDYGSSNNSGYSNNYSGSSCCSYGSSYSSSSYPEGQTCRITVNNGKVRSGAGAQYSSLGTVWYGESYKVLDTALASNGVTWYKISFNGRYGWISSGLTNFGKH